MDLEDDDDENLEDGADRPRKGTYAKQLVRSHLPYFYAVVS